MRNHIAQLYEKTKDIEIFIASAYEWVDGKNIPSLGIRDKENKGVVIDGIAWLISGTVRKKTTHKPVQYLSMLKANLDNVYIDLRAQAIPYGECFVHVDLGKRKIVHTEMGEDRIFAHLEVM